MAGKLEGKVAIVTGASRGIGQAVAVLFGQEGAAVAVAARSERQLHERLPGTIYETAEQVNRAGGKALAVRCDISHPEDVLNLVERTREAFGRIDIVVNNAALNYYFPFSDYPANRWHKVFEVNLFGPMMLIQAVLPEMVERRSGAIVNISSGASRGPGPGPYTGNERGGGTVYGATKAALERLTQGLAQELFQYNIAVNALSPSALVPTPGATFHGFEPGADTYLEPAEYMARAALILATASARELTGRIYFSQDLLKERGLL